VRYVLCRLKSGKYKPLGYYLVCCNNVVRNLGSRAGGLIIVELIEVSLTSSPLCGQVNIAPVNAPAFTSHFASTRLIPPQKRNTKTSTQLLYCGAVYIYELKLLSPETQRCSWRVAFEASNELCWERWSYSSPVRTC
jgi:hypothetical protein